MRVGAIPVSLPVLALLSTPFSAMHSKIRSQIILQTSLALLQRGQCDWRIQSGGAVQRRLTLSRRSPPLSGSAVTVGLKAHRIMDILKASSRTTGSRPTHVGLRAVASGGFGGFLKDRCTGDARSKPGHYVAVGVFRCSCVLLFEDPASPFAQPANVVGGHCIRTLIGLVALHGLGSGVCSLALAAGISIDAIMVTRTVHPPAGSNPAIVFLGHAGWTYFLFPVLSGAIVLVLIALLYDDVIRKYRYLTYGSVFLRRNACR